MQIDLFNGLEVIQDILAVVVTFLLIQAFIMLNDFFKRNEIFSSTVTRKFIHIWAAPIYVLCWPLYSEQWFSPWISMIVPSIFALQFILIGTGKMENEPFVESMCRSGDPAELLKGTLYYTVFMMVGAILFWGVDPVNSPVGVVMFMTLAFGDGLADITGRTLNKMTFTNPFGSTKSIPGTLAMFIASLVFSLVGLVIFGFNLDDLLVVTVIAGIFATIIELISPPETDNIWIPLAIMFIFFVWYFLMTPTTWSLYELPLPS